MSIDAEAYMKRLGRRFFEKVPNHKVWNFDTGANTPVHNELRNLGYINWMGTRDGPYVLTDQGRDWMLQHRAELESSHDQR
jgi:hypothetical protein